ncbi:MAG: hypothetical protein OEW29_06850 [Acidimicrobiia bacterium]|nr:hypothetical protein [Acidimicrobiia bacterium]MDH4365188.1 hypothetical protein [Acidimicrobiia bacterium]
MLAIGAIQESVDAGLDRQIAACGDARAGIAGALQPCFASSRAASC